MSNFFARRGMKGRNESVQSFSLLVGIAEGLLADRSLNDQEIHFLRDWLEHDGVSLDEWPGSVIYERVQNILEDGVITEGEREHLIETLRRLVGGTLEELAQSPRVAELALDAVERVDFAGRKFCLTGDFVFAPRTTCEAAIVERGGKVTGSVSRRTDFLVVGGLGSKEWKFGSFGTKIEKAMLEKQLHGRPLIVHEDVWAASL